MNNPVAESFSDKKGNKLPGDTTLITPTNNLFGSSDPPRKRSYRDNRV